MTKVQELANANASQSVSPSRFGSVTMLQSNIDEKTTGGASKMMLLEDQTLLMSKKNLNSKKSLLNVESKHSFALRNERSTDDLNVNKMNRINSIKSLIEK